MNALLKRLIGKWSPLSGPLSICCAKRPPSAMVALETDRFLNELGRLFDRTKAKGCVTITMKRSAQLHGPCVLCLCLTQSSERVQGRAGNMKPRKSRHPHPVRRLACVGSCPTPLPDFPVT